MPARRRLRQSTRRSARSFLECWPSDLAKLSGPMATADRSLTTTPEHYGEDRFPRECSPGRLEEGTGKRPFNEIALIAIEREIPLQYAQ